MASILDRLPHTGHGVVFSGRVGAVRLPDGRQLLISAGGTESFGQAAEPVDNWRTGPDERHPARRPSYMHAFPLSYAPSAVRLAKAKDPWPWASGPWAGGEHDWTSLALLLWRRRDTPDDYVRQDPYTGGAIRVCQALRQTALAGSQAVALSYQLRFGDFDGDSEAMYQLAKTVEGMSD
ncbi:MAG: hypothetical protein KGJ86_12185, partial [Chloroflexota bacterium]|nr:hypothetical protein [Chloroflexota bacterium]